MQRLMSILLVQPTVATARRLLLTERFTHAAGIVSLIQRTRAIAAIDLERLSYLIAQVVVISQAYAQSARTYR